MRGPCRFGSGEALQPGFDRLLNAQIAEEFLGYLKSTAPAGVELLDLVSIGRTDNWENKEEMWDTVREALVAAY
ncbi:MAG: hypothetical protein IJ061_02710 [Lachnospiraceae bacterium]|nr:hypothetical protein [Lachnospiraceae bacterium]